MNGGTKELSQELDAMANVFADLGDRLLQEATQLRSRRSLPPEGLMEELAGARADFGALRGRAVQLAESMEVHRSSDAELSSLEDLASLLAATAEAEVRREKLEDVRSRARSVLERILSLSHTGPEAFPPLVECQAGARALSEAIQAHPTSRLPEDAERLAEGDHPLANLLMLVEAPEDLGDESWLSLHDAVSEAFGKGLAAAAARSRLVSTDERRPPAAPLIPQHLENRR